MPMNRREMLKGAVGSSIAIAGMSWLSLPATAQSARSQVTLTWVSTSSYRDMNPASTGGVEIQVLGNVYETLLFYKDGKVLPKLATSWEGTDGGKTWTVSLRKGVKFHDGSPLNSAAVKRSFEYTRDLGKTAGYALAGLESVETPDEHAVIFHFKDPVAFDLVAAGQSGAFVMGLAAIDHGDEWLTQGNAIGTGPYKLAQFQQGKMAVLQKFDDYWGGWESGQVDRVLHPYVAEVSTRVQMIRSGDADISRIPASQMEGSAAQLDVSVTNTPSWLNQLFMINTQKYPTDNLKFRQALLHLWDHDSVIKDIFHGAAGKPVGPLPSTLWGHGTYDLGTFDPEKALMLLEESGIPRKDWKIKAMFSAFSQEAVDAIELFRANASAVGLEVELELHNEGSTYMSKARSPETAGHLNSMTWWPAYPTPSDFLALAFRTEKKPTWNLSYYYDEDFDRLVDQALKLEAVDKDAAANAYIAAQDRLMKNAVAIFYADVNRVNAYSSDIKGMEDANNPAYEWLSIYSLRR
ncbi:peptide/nickel transport system substrate-binding protein (plasmid) [Ensifer sp. WSM1721]|uniref:ABC transporter substrate-binding protein n=1 Tax=Ensifer sp. WSM1721 TaxID=1041159 RepID=UPI0004BB73F8|nr:ABC transporter substrate-binding protein [Ensifer sp. WSM1721]